MLKCTGNWFYGYTHTSTQTYTHTQWNISKYSKFYHRYCEIFPKYAILYRELEYLREYLREYFKYWNISLKYAMK